MAKKRDIGGLLRLLASNGNTLGYEAEQAVHDRARTKAHECLLEATNSELRRRHLS